MGHLIERIFNLKSGGKQVFLEIIDKYKAELEADQYIKTYAVLSPDNEDTVILRFIPKDGVSWDERMQQDYVQRYKKEIDDKDILDKVTIRNLTIHQFYSE